MNKRNLIWYLGLTVVLVIALGAFARYTNIQAASENLAPGADHPASVIWSGDFSSDDVYDPAAGGLTLEEYQSCSDKLHSPNVSGQFSDDDKYDPAAGGFSLEEFRACWSKVQ